MSISDMRCNTPVAAPPNNQLSGSPSREAVQTHGFQTPVAGFLSLKSNADAGLHTQTFLETFTAGFVAEPLTLHVLLLFAYLVTLGPYHDTSILIGHSVHP